MGPQAAICRFTSGFTFQPQMRYPVLVQISATHPNCASYSYTVRACLIVTVHGSISCTDHFVLQDQACARRSTYPIGSRLQVDTSSCRTKWIRPPGSPKNEACVVCMVPAVAGSRPPTPIVRVTLIQYVLV